jgi:hypothetical protein
MFTISPADWYSHVLCAVCNEIFPRIPVFLKLWRDSNVCEDDVLGDLRV